jgi:hypothetical protein
MSGKVVMSSAARKEPTYKPGQIKAASQIKSPSLATYASLLLIINSCSCGEACFDIFEGPATFSDRKEGCFLTYCRCFADKMSGRERVNERHLECTPLSNIC